MFAAATPASLLRILPRTQTKRETAINQRPIRVSLVPCGRIESLRIISVPPETVQRSGSR